MFPPDDRAGLFLDGQSLPQAGGERHIPRAFALFFCLSLIFGTQRWIGEGRLGIGDSLFEAPAVGSPP